MALAVPLAFRIFSRKALTGSRIFHEALPVINDYTAIKLIVKDAVAPLAGAQQPRRSSGRRSAQECPIGSVQR